MDREGVLEEVTSVASAPDRGPPSATKELKSTYQQGKYQIQGTKELRVYNILGYTDNDIGGNPTTCGGTSESPAKE